MAFGTVFDRSVPPRSYLSLLATRGIGSCFCSKVSITQMIEKVFPGEISHGPLLPDLHPAAASCRASNFSGRLGFRFLNGDGAKDSETSVGGHLHEIWLFSVPDKFTMKRVLLGFWLFGMNRGCPVAGDGTVKQYLSL